MEPKIIDGSVFSDSRGQLFYNNNFISSAVQRFYIIQNINCEFKRGWQGHQIEQRWFSAVNGSFKIQLIKIDHWENPTRNLKPIIFILESKNLDVLHMPPGFVSCIQSMEEESKLLVMADYLVGAIDDDFRFDLNYFI